jgi:uncharacterized protein YndB with AHSA1/START domain
MRKSNLCNRMVAPEGRSGVDEETRVEREIVVDARPDEVWAALTEPEQLSAWFGAAAEAQGDGSVTFRGGDGTVRRAVIDVSEPERLLILRWLPFERNASGRVIQRPAAKVIFTLTPCPEGTRLRVVEMPAGVPQAQVLRAVAPR